MNKQHLAFAALILGASSAAAETFTFTKPANQRPDYSAHATGPSLEIDGTSYSFLPQARTERSSSQPSSSLPVPSIAVEAVGGAVAPTSSSSSNEFLPQAVTSNSDEYLGSRGRYDIYLSAAPEVQSNSVGSSGNTGCGYCQVVVNARTGELALFTNEVLVNLDTNTREFAEQLAADNGARLKYYMGRMALAVLEAPDAQSALDLTASLSAHPQVRKAKNSVVERDYQPQ